MTWASLSLLAFLILKASAKNCIPIDGLSMQEAFRVFMIVPQIIPVTPEAVLTEIYGEWIVNLGNRIPLWCTTVQPYTTWTNVNLRDLYTLVLFDPDSPQYVTNNGTQHLLGAVVNIPGPNINDGDVLVPYSGAAPLAGSGDHRYITLIYKQLGRIAVTTKILKSILANLQKFSISEFVEQFKLGKPVAGNFFRSRQGLCDAPRANTQVKRTCNVLNCVKQI